MRSSLSATLLPKGFRFAATACGLKKRGLDLGLIVSEIPASAACVFTTNRVKAAPVIVSQENMKRSAKKIMAVIVNSGNANCATGSSGLAASKQTAATVAHAMPCRAEQIVVCSTGVIGMPLQVQHILRAIPGLKSKCAGTPESFQQFVRAIMTTDRRPKWAVANCVIGGEKIRLLGCAKGAGMIHPNMATMLSFILTDATVSPSVLRRALRQAVAKTFNAITVDGDTSTNDTLALLANGACGARSVPDDGSSYRNFLAALESVCRSLALQIVADGEGAHRVVEIEVKGAASNEGADAIARTIANSPLVKTALAGADPNWGRILAAAGRAGVPFDSNRAEIRMVGTMMCHKGTAIEFDERAAHRKLLAKHIPIVVDLHAGTHSVRIWTCDFTGDYVRINASYRS
jgi:glutamate N-acetyltransferase / amino-acid N-acetyltransferase